MLLLKHFEIFKIKYSILVIQNNRSEIVVIGYSLGLRQGRNHQDFAKGLENGKFL